MMSHLERAVSFPYAVKNELKRADSKMAARERKQKV
jgi:hypothetical protein